MVIQVKSGELSTLKDGDIRLDKSTGEYNIFDTLHIEKGEWHMLKNETESPLRIVEIQYGESCTEDDIERK